MAVEKSGHVDEKVLHNFAKRLANNEPRLRKNALKKLKGWMEARSGNIKSTFVLKIVFMLRAIDRSALSIDRAAPSMDLLLAQASIDRAAIGGSRCVTDG